MTTQDQRASSTSHEQHNKGDAAGVVANRHQFFLCRTNETIAGKPNQKAQTSCAWHHAQCLMAVVIHHISLVNVPAYHLKTACVHRRESMLLTEEQCLSEKKIQDVGSWLEYDIYRERFYKAQEHKAIVVRTPHTYLLLLHGDEVYYQRVVDPCRLHVSQRRDPLNWRARYYRWIWKWNDWCPSFWRVHWKKFFICTHFSHNNHMMQSSLPWINLSECELNRKWGMTLLFWHTLAFLVIFVISAIEL